MECPLLPCFCSEDHPHWGTVSRQVWLGPQGTCIPDVPSPGPAKVGPWRKAFIPCCAGRKDPTSPVLSCYRSGDKVEGSLLSFLSFLFYLLVPHFNWFSFLCNFFSQTTPCFPQLSNPPGTWKCCCFCERCFSSWAESLVSQTHHSGGCSDGCMDWSVGSMSPGVSSGDFKILPSNSNMRWIMILWQETFCSKKQLHENQNSGVSLAIDEKNNFSMTMAETIKSMEGKKHSPSGLL